MVPVQTFVKDSGFFKAAVGSDFQVQSCDSASYLLLYVTCVRILEIRAIKGLRHGHGSSSAPRQDFSNQMEHFAYTTH